jgi:gliding motility-associated-like protein
VATVCLGEPVSFSPTGSAAAAGFTLTDYIWDFADETGTTTALPSAVSHTFDAPGEYIVTLTVQDNNGCQSLNIIPLQVLVSTNPLFEGLADLNTCLGQTVQAIVEVGEVSPGNIDNAINGVVNGVTWTALPPQVVSGQTYLADGAGFSFSSSLVFDFFETGQILTTCDDLLNIFVNMEHSYMGDLSITIACPNGTVVDLVTFPSGGGGTFIGEATDGAGDTPGIGYDYWWDQNATTGTWGANANSTFIDFVDEDGLPWNNQPILPSGTYNPVGDLCQLVGCPLNGEWTMQITDNIGADNGYIFSWGVGFDPSLFPDVTTFTPTIGPDADSSYWVTNGAEYISAISLDGDIITIDAEEPGTYNYTYVVINSFGCTFETDINVIVEQSPLESAGPDLVFACDPVQLNGGFQGTPSIPCADCGTFQHCYGENELTTTTFCPTTLGDGPVTIVFEQGSTENGFDQLIIYDGPDDTAPQLGSFDQDLAGLFWSSSHPTGCLTMAFDSDGSVSCASGSQTEWIYTVHTGDPEELNFVWEWTPVTYLNDANIADPIVDLINEETTYTLFGYPIGHPDCGSTDQATVEITSVGNPGISNDIYMCINETNPLDMTDALNGNPTNNGVWTGPDGAILTNDTFDPASMPEGQYTYTIDLSDCELFSNLTIDFSTIPLVNIENDTTICFGTEANLTVLSLLNGEAPLSYQWTYNDAPVSNTTDFIYSPNSSGLACFTVTDDCGVNDQACMFVEVEPFIEPTIGVADNSLCWPEPFELFTTVDPANYTTNNWQLIEGESILNEDSLEFMFSSPGLYDVIYSITTPTGCVYTLEYPNYLTSFAPPVASFQASPQPTNSENTLIQFDNNTNGDISTYAWTFGNPAIGSSSLSDPAFQFPIGIGGVYPVTLNVTDQNGCVDQIIGSVDINDILNFFTPNTFTPNADGINDVFQFYGTDIDPNDFNFNVFNRWGEVVFATNDPTKAWTGEHQSGDYYAPNGTYNWTARFRSESNGELRELKGYIILFR